MKRIWSWIDKAERTAGAKCRGGRYISSSFRCQARCSPVFWWVGRAEMVTVGKGVLVVQSVIQES